MVLKPGRIHILLNVNLLKEDLNIFSKKIEILLQK